MIAGAKPKKCLILCICKEYTSISRILKNKHASIPNLGRNTYIPMYYFCKENVTFLQHILENIKKTSYNILFYNIVKYNVFPFSYLS